MQEIKPEEIGITDNKSLSFSKYDLLEFGELASIPKLSSACLFTQARKKKKKSEKLISHGDKTSSFWMEKAPAISLRVYKIAKVNISKMAFLFNKKE